MEKVIQSNQPNKMRVFLCVYNWDTFMESYLNTLIAYFKDQVEFVTEYDFKNGVSYIDSTDKFLCLIGREKDAIRYIDAEQLINHALLNKKEFIAVDIDDTKYVPPLLAKSLTARWIRRFDLDEIAKALLNLKSEEPKKYSFPQLKLTSYEKEWLELVYERFLANQPFEVMHLLTQYEDRFPKSFEPKKIDGRLLSAGRSISLLGILHIYPDALIISNTDKVIRAIQKIIKEENRKGNPIKEVTSEQILSICPEIIFQQMWPIIDVIGHFRNFSRGGGRRENFFSINIDDDEIYNRYRTYNGLQELINEEYGNIETTKSPAPTRKRTKQKEPVKRAVENAQKLSYQRYLFTIKDRNEIDGVLGVEELAVELAQVIKFMPKEKGKMIGIFGRWGRGKTFLMEQLWEQLEAGKNYYKVDFHAWKYQDTPASWAYLYEQLSDEYYKTKNRFTGGLVKLWRTFKLNKSRDGLFPIFKFIIPFVFSAFCLFGLYKVNREYISLIGIPVIGSGLLLALKKWKKEYGTSALDLIHKYSSRQSFRETMGMQAEIQKEIRYLLKAWIPKEDDKRIVLFVDDIDRCTEDRIIQNIDALRVMLEDDFISDKIIVVAAIDEQVLKRAIKSKYHNLVALDHTFSSENKRVYLTEDDRFNRMEQLTTEYIDKLFISGVKLGVLSGDQRIEYFNELVKKDQAPEKEKSVIQKIENEVAVEESPEKELMNKYIYQGMGGRERFKAPAEKKNMQQAETIVAESIDEKSIDLIDKPVNIPLKEEPGLLPEEIVTLRECLKDFRQTTPRQIRIFYYRYLFARNLLVKRYEDISRENKWQDGNSHILPKLIIAYTHLHNPDIITADKEALFSKNQEDEVPVMHLEGQSVPAGDYIELLKVLEMVVAY